MRTYKITHTKLIESEYDTSKKVYDTTHYTIVHAENKEQAIEKVKPEIVLHIEDRGSKKEDIFNEWWETWSNKAKKHKEDILYEIRKIKSPSHNKK
jgi:hypothetical protein